MQPTKCHPGRGLIRIWVCLAVVLSLVAGPVAGHLVMACVSAPAARVAGVGAEKLWATKNSDGCRMAAAPVARGSENTGGEEPKGPGREPCDRCPVCITGTTTFTPPDTDDGLVFSPGPVLRLALHVERGPVQSVERPRPSRGPPAA